jgi:predicted DNA-binding antitoxin AbrB/MazE fold protein
MDKVRVLGDLQKVSLKDGDTVALLVDQNLTKDQTDRINDYLGRAFPNNKAVVLQAGMRIGVLGNDDRIDRIESRLDAIAELLAVLLDSVQDEECGGIGHGPCDCNILDAANLDEELTANGYMGQ